MPQETEVLKNEAGLFIEFFHVPSGRSVSMKAMLTNLVDTYSSNWNEEQVYGRPDPLATFNSTKRVLSVGFEVIAEDIEEAIQNQINLQMIARFQYPAYSQNEFGATGISGAPLMKLKFLNLIWNAENRSKAVAYSYHSPAENAGLIGKMGGFANVTNTDTGFFQDPDSKALYPVSYTIDFEYLVLHSHPLGWHKENFRSNGFPYGHLIDGDGAPKVANNQPDSNKILSVAEKETITANERLAQKIFGDNFQVTDDDPDSPPVVEIGGDLIIF